MGFGLSMEVVVWICSVVIKYLCAIFKGQSSSLENTEAFLKVAWKGEA
jgi:hypothetical protein